MDYYLAVWINSAGFEYIIVYQCGLTVQALSALLSSGVDKRCRSLRALLSVTGLLRVETAGFLAAGGDTRVVTARQVNAFNADLLIAVFVLG